MSEPNVQFAFDRMGLDLIQRGSGTENKISSPLSIVFATSLLAFCSDGVERERLLNWLGVPFTNDNDLADALQILKDTFLGDEYDQYRGLQSMFWGVFTFEEKLPQLEGRFTQAVGERLELPIAVFEGTPDVSYINDAISEATRGRIQKFFKSQPAEQFTCFVNALYLRGSWRVHLETRELFEWLLPDATLTVLFIGDIGKFKFASTKSYRYVALGIWEEREMEIFLTRNPKQLPTGLTLKDMNALRARAREVEMKLFIPRFKVGEFRDIADYLAECGVVFGQCPLARELILLHGAQLRVTEDGVEAVAVTVGMGIDAAGSSEEEEEEDIEVFKVDRPFIFTLRNGSVTEFMGYIYKVEDPIQRDYHSTDSSDDYD